MAHLGAIGSYEPDLTEMVYNATPTNYRIRQLNIIATQLWPDSGQQYPPGFIGNF